MLTPRRCLTCAFRHAWVLRFQMLLDQKEQSTPSSSAHREGYPNGPPRTPTTSDRRPPYDPGTSRFRLRNRRYWG
jgi:hypothetical protein